MPALDSETPVGNGEPAGEIAKVPPRRTAEGRVLLRSKVETESANKPSEPSMTYATVGGGGGGGAAGGGGAGGRVGTPSPPTGGTGAAPASWVPPPQAVSKPSKLETNATRREILDMADGSNALSRGGLTPTGLSLLSPR